jgi:ankyrin repeat protein
MSGASLADVVDTGDIEAVKTMLASGVVHVDAVNVRGLTALHVATLNSDVDMIDVLLSAGADPNAGNHPTKQKPLHVAAWEGDLYTMRRLLLSAANVNAMEHNWTALHSATLQPRADVMQLLLAAGADVHLRNHEEDQPIHLVAMNSDVQCMRLLLAAGADINSVDVDGCTALHYSVRRRNCMEMVHFLCTSGIDVNVVDHRGETALHLAALYYRVDIVCYLLQVGADVETTLNSDDIYYFLCSLNPIYEHRQRQRRWALIRVAWLVGCTSLAVAKSI